MRAHTQTHTVMIIDVTSKMFTDKTLIIRKIHKHPVVTNTLSSAAITGKNNIDLYSTVTPPLQAGSGK